MVKSVVGAILGVVGINHIIQGIVATVTDIGVKVGMADEDDWEFIHPGPLQKPVFDSAPRYPILSAAPKYSTKPQQSLFSTAPLSLARVVPSGTPKRLPDNLDHRPGSVAKLTDAKRGASPATPLQPEPQSSGIHVFQGKTSASSRVSRAKKPSDIAWIVELWVEILQWFGETSSFFMEIRHSEKFRHFAVVVLDAFAPSTMAKYLTCLQSFCKVCDDLRINIQDLTSVQVLDIAQMGKRNSGASGGLILKSLKWIFKHANISSLSIMDSPLIAHWDKSKIPRDRAEALPLPLYVIIAWERRLLEKGCTLLEKLLLGSFLLMVWSGLRYSDLQRTIWKSISYNFAELRAICWRTKTCTKGQPYGLLASGFLSRGDHNWLFVFLQSQDSIRASAEFLDDEDFILPEFDAFGVVYPLRPMSYAAALLRFRQSLAIPWRSNSSTSEIHTSSYTIHCMKSTLLSWGSQLAQSGLVTTEQRRQQGHHKALTTSISLYSRDDVHGQVKFHGTLISQVRDGWRPTLPQHRGGQLPTVEPSVSIEAFRKPIPAYNFQTIRVHQSGTPINVSVDIGDSAEIDADVSSDESSSSSSSDSSDDEATTVSASASSLICFGRFRSVTHAMISSSADQSNIATWQGDSIQTACGVRFASNRIQLSYVSSQVNNLTFCQHRACHKILAMKL